MTASIQWLTSAWNRPIKFIYTLFRSHVFAMMWRRLTREGLPKTLNRIHKMVNIQSLHHYMILYKTLIMSLPSELILETLQYLDKTDLKSVRLVSKLWSDCASENLFAKLYISPHRLNLLVFASVTRHPVLRRYVKKIKYDAVHFSPEITISEYFGKLWRQWHQLFSKASITEDLIYSNPDPQIRCFGTSFTVSGRDRRRGQEEDWAQREDFDFVREGYHEWMEQAAYEKKCSEGGTLLRLLMAGLRQFVRLRTVRLTGGWPFGGKLRCEGSPLARTWQPFHAQPEGWIFGDADSPQRPSSAFMDIWAIAFALSEAGVTQIRNLSIESALPPTAFATKLGWNENHLECPLAAYCRLEYLKLTLAGYPDQPMVGKHANLHGLQRMLESMTSLRRFELNLPDTYANSPVEFFTYTLTFPDDGHWPQITTFKVRNLAIGTKDMITLLFAKMPSLRHLSFGHINLLDGRWQSIVEYLRFTNRLSSFEIDLDSMLYHRGNRDYITHDTWPSYRRHNDSIRFIEDYVVNWWNNPTLRHPSLTVHQPAQQSLNYLKDVYLLCETDIGRDTLDKLAEHMVEEAARYRKLAEEWNRKDWFDNLPVRLQERSMANVY